MHGNVIYGVSGDVIGLMSPSTLLGVLSSCDVKERDVDVASRNLRTALSTPEVKRIGQNVFRASVLVYVAITSIGA